MSMVPAQKADERNGADLPLPNDIGSGCAVVQGAARLCLLGPFGSLGCSRPRGRRRTRRSLMAV